MRVAAIYDVHGNAPALESVLGDVLAADVDGIVIGGDVVPGPMPRECLALLRELDLPVRCIRGNGESAVLAAMRGEEPTGVPVPMRPLIDWTAGQLDDAHAAWLEDWTATLRLRVDGIGDVFFCHATPRNDTDIFTRRTPEERLVPLFEDLGADLVVCGHTHMPFDRTIGGTRVVNAGSTGMPFGEPGAFWLRLGPDVEPRRTDYDLEAAAARIRATSYPQAEAFASGNVLEPPTEAAMLEMLSRAEL